MWTRRLSEIALFAVLASSAPALAAEPQDDALTEYRERFRRGMDRFKAGAYTEAIGFWEPLYGELGEQKGYRLAYNLGVAYEELGDATLAAERLESFLGTVDTRRAAEEPIEPLVAKEEVDAHARLESLSAVKGRIRVYPGEPPRSVQVDAMPARVSSFVAWVAPGAHTVTYSPSTMLAETRRVEVRAGELVEVSPAPPSPVPATTTHATADPAPRPPPAPTPPAPEVRSEMVHPFSPSLLYLSGGLAVAAALVAVPLESSAWTLHNQDVGQSTITTSERQSFDNARTGAYASIGLAVGLGLAAVGLTTWYFVGGRERQVLVGPGVVAGKF